jgi:hypothetical protein
LTTVPLSANAKPPEIGNSPEVHNVSASTHFWLPAL